MRVNRLGSMLATVVVLSAKIASAENQAPSLMPTGTSIDQICSSSAKPKNIRSLRELQESILQTCRENESRAGGDKIVPLANDALDILRQFPDDMSIEDNSFDPQAKNYDKMKALQEKLDQLATAVGNDWRKSSFEAPKSPLGNRLRSLREEFGPDSPTAKAEKAKDRKGYNQRMLNRMMDTLRMTEAGKKALKCWENKPGAPVVGDEFVVAPPGGNTAMYVTVNTALYEEHDVLLSTGKKPSKPKKGEAPTFVRRILINPDSDPIELLHTLQHEMIHSCGAAHDCKTNTDYQKEYAASQARSAACCPGDKPTPECMACYDKEEKHMASFNRSKDQDGLVDECRAFSAQVEFYKELAAADPGLVCNHQYRSGFYDNQIVSSGQYQAGSEKYLREGDFGLIVGRAYSIPKGAPLNPRNLFSDYVPGGPPPTKLRPELVEKLKAAGCPVR